MANSYDACACGAKKRTKAKRCRVCYQRTKTESRAHMETDIVARFRDGESLPAIGAAHEVSTSVVTNVLRAAGQIGDGRVGPRPRPRDQDESGEEGDFTYAMRAVGTDFVKIGRAHDPDDRLFTVQAGCPHLLILEEVFEGGDLESLLHRRFSRRRVRREWFELGQDARHMLRAEAAQARESMSRARERFMQGAALGEIVARMPPPETGTVPTAMTANIAALAGTARWLGLDALADDLNTVAREHDGRTRVDAERFR